MFDVPDEEGQDTDERSEADQGGECVHPEFLHEYGLRRDRDLLCRDDGAVRVHDVDDRSVQFMSYMARATYSESGQLLDSGVDLNMEGGIAEHVKDLIILTSGVQILSLISNYFWLLWLLVPLRGGWMLWKQILAPWFFAQPEEQPEISEKKQRKLEKKMARRH
ncbi:transmembrane protein 208 isoform X4 [Ooceraea biroi]|uniref:transmembrane protein 208 isoform X4 n=1 Tax=Ooceraea biroi TaxID=2015173 RepID=UPI0005BC2DFB|nr:transmembrane protein 208 isoform X4 [Ooceraea biroi]